VQIVQVILRSRSYETQAKIVLRNEVSSTIHSHGTLYCDTGFSLHFINLNLYRSILPKIEVPMGFLRFSEIQQFIQNLRCLPVPRQAAHCVRPFPPHTWQLYIGKVRDEPSSVDCLTLNDAMVYLLQTAGRCTYRASFISATR
jgi:hypothetical protein